MLKKVVTIICLVCISISLLAGCTGEKDRGTREVVDSLGRNVIIPYDINRIASFNTDLTEIIIALGGLDKLVIQDFNSFAGASWIGKHFPQLRELPAPYSPAGFNVEELLNARPDIIITTSIGTLPFSELENVQELYGIPVLCFSFQSLDTYFEELALLSYVIGAGEHGENISKFLSDFIDSVTERVAHIEEDARVRVYHALSNEFRTFGAGIFQESQIRRAGGINVTNELSGFNILINAEQLYVWDPDIIIMLYEAAPNSFYDNEQLRDLRAVINRNVHRHPEPGWGFLTPRAIFAVKWLSYHFYPELYTDINIDNEADAFYMKVYNFGRTFVNGQ